MSGAKAATGSLAPAASPVLLQCPQLASVSPAISHGFFTRIGGVSKGIFEGLNTGIGSQDDPRAVQANRTAATFAVGGKDAVLASVFQVHSPDVVAVTKDWQPDNRPRADAMVTATPGMVLGILTADCGPVLFADPQAVVIGAAHAGWKGATGGVLENTIAGMESLGASRDNIIATLGPTISMQSYEVGPEFVERLLALSAQNDAFLTPSRKSDHAMFDLPGYIVARLAAAGVQASWTGHCTYADEERFYSYRRKTHRQEPDYGRQISAIVIKQS